MKSTPDRIADANVGRQPGRLFWYAWHPRDFRASTLGWPLIAKAIYRDLLDCQFDMGALPADPAKLRTLIGATPAQWRDSWLQFLERKFPLGDDGHRRNARLEEHRQHALKLSAERAKSGRLGAAKTNAARSKVIPIGARDVG